MEPDLQWDFFDHLPVVLQDATTRDVLMVQYMTEEGLRKTIEERSMWL
jgi:phosphoribosyl-AMP cyclohydrolase